MTILDNQIRNFVTIIKRGHLGKPDKLYVEFNGQVFQAEEKTQHESFKKLKSDIEVYANLDV